MEIGQSERLFWEYNELMKELERAGKYMNNWDVEKKEFDLYVKQQQIIAILRSFDADGGESE